MITAQSSILVIHLEVVILVAQWKEKNVISLGIKFVGQPQATTSLLYYAFHLHCQIMTHYKEARSKLR